MQIERNTPVGALTVDQLMNVIRNGNSQFEAPAKPQEKEKRFVYGLKGIRNLFNVSHSTAHRYKETFLKPAIKQVGRKIIVDADKAIELFDEVKP